MKRQALRWFGKSVAGFVLGLVLLAGWVEVVGIRPELALVLNHILISIVMYRLVDQWVFEDLPSPTTWRGHGLRYLQFQAVMLSSSGAKYVLFVILVTVGVWYPVAWTVGAGTLFVFGFIGNREVWRRFSIS